MAKLKAPLMSLGASGAIGHALVFFPWKGLDVVREYVVPANPKTSAQSTQRGYLTAAVAAIHTAQALAANPLDADDVIAYSLLGSTHPTPRTWFNEICKRWIDQRVKSLRMAIMRDGSVVAASTTLTVTMHRSVDDVNDITAADFWYGTSKTALVNSKAATFDPDGRAYTTITGLTNGTKYYVQLRPTAHADFVGVRSGIYYGTPSA